ncbi:hypothetical protein [Candidatus Bealeia paramacronuclearis]|uniref:hypothetical protein n=1 Tax=Candidatus Bealeia paramacronuclearis TaxID=1921001 RepID=UPI002F267052
MNYDIQQVQHDIERLQRDLSRLHNDAASPAISSRYEPAVLYDPLHAEEVVAYERITTPDAYENQDWLPTAIPAISMIDKEIAQAELEEAQQALTTAREILKDADIASVLANSNMENINMINTTSRSQKIRNAIAALLAAASTLIAAEAGAMWQEKDVRSLSPRKEQFETGLYLTNLSEKSIFLQKVNIKFGKIIKQTHAEGSELKKNESFRINISHTLNCEDDFLNKKESFITITDQNNGLAVFNFVTNGTFNAHLIPESNKKNFCLTSGMSSYNSNGMYNTYTIREIK